MRDIDYISNPLNWRADKWDRWMKVSLVCDFSQGKVNRCQLTPDKAATTLQRQDPTQVQPDESMSLLQPSKENRKGVQYYFQVHGWLKGICITKNPHPNMSDGHSPPSTICRHLSWWKVASHLHPLLLDQGELLKALVTFWALWIAWVSLFPGENTQAWRKELHSTDSD